MIKFLGTLIAVLLGAWIEHTYTVAKAVKAVMKEEDQNAEKNEETTEE